MGPLIGEWERTPLWLQAFGKPPLRRHVVWAHSDEWRYAGPGDVEILERPRAGEAGIGEGDERPGRTFTVQEAFDLGFQWRGQLTGQSLEDSRAVARTLAGDLFEGMSIDDRQVPGFDSADAGIHHAKKAIERALHPRPGSAR